METVVKDDFIEIEFIGKSNGEVFDTTDKEEAKKIGIEADVKPMIISVGNQMMIKGLDDELVGKEVGKEYFAHLLPEKAFGKRDPKLLKIMPIKIFHEKKIEPMPGMSFQLDYNIVRIASVSGGRVTVDFNNPLAGKEVDYEYKIIRKVTDDKEKVNALQDFFFRQRFDFELKDKSVIFKKQEIKPFIEMFKQKFKDITGLEFSVEENKKEVKKEEKKQEDKENSPKTENKK